MPAGEKERVKNNKVKIQLADVPRHALET